MSNGVLCDSNIAELIANKSIYSSKGILPEQIQPASLDLTLSGKIERCKCSDLNNVDLFYECSSMINGYFELKVDNTYILELNERVSLSGDIRALCSPKSSIGRLDIFVRLLTESKQEFDKVEAGYKGRLFLEVTPLSFDIKVREGDALAQLRFIKGEPDCYDINLTLDLSGQGDSSIGLSVLWANEIIDLQKIGYYDYDYCFYKLDYNYHKSGIAIRPNQFYILATNEPVAIPPDYCAEMLPYEHTFGEFRAHYAGFFDPGFGLNQPSKAVLEIRGHSVAFKLHHGQKICKLRFEKMLNTPKNLYGKDIGSHYQGQGLKLSKHFKEISA